MADPPPRPLYGISADNSVGFKLWEQERVERLFTTPTTTNKSAELH